MEDYRQLDGVNYSSLKLYHRSPLHYKHYIENPSESTEAQKLGTLVHTLVLEPHKFEQEYTVFNPNDRPNTAADFRNAENKLWKQVIIEEAANHGRMVIDSETFDKANGMAKNVLRIPAVQKLLASAEIESGIQWTDQMTGVLCKGKPDGYNKSTRVVFDLKTTISAHPTDFQRSIWNYRYHEQAAFYVNGLNAIHGDGTFKRFIFIAVEKDAPYAASIFMLAESALNVGWITCQSLLNMHKQCSDSNNWSYQYDILSQHSSGVIDMDLPDFAYMKAENDELTNQF
jgi:hypothetical protein